MASKIMRFRYFLSFLLVLLAQVNCFAGDTLENNPEMASALRESGKIYVVVLVLATIFAGIIAFLIYLERRLSRIERELGGRS
jgi:hypothetical protein